MLPMLYHVLIGDNERVLVIRKRRFVEILGPGERWIFGRGVELLAHNVRDLVFAGDWADHIAQPPARNRVALLHGNRDILRASGRRAPGRPPRARDRPFQPRAVLEGRVERDLRVHRCARRARSARPSVAGAGAIGPRIRRDLRRHRPRQAWAAVPRRASDP